MAIHRMIRALIPLLIPSLTVGGPAFAQSIPSPYRYIENGQEAGVLAGTLFLTRGSWDLAPESGNFLGGRYLIEVSGPLFMEGLLTYLPTSRKVIDPRRSEGDRAIGKTDAHIVMAEARLSFSLTGRRTWHGLSPHLFIGGGVATDAAGSSKLEEVLLQDDRFDFGTNFTVSAGTGLRFALSSKIMLRLDPSMILWRIDTPAGFDDPVKGLGTQDEPVAEREWINGYALTLGVAWRF